MAPQLLTNDGRAFQSYLAGDRKLLKESPEILDSITSRVLRLRPGAVLICGDLTKDGERVSHELLHGRYLRQFLSRGIKVFVIPGNHDVNNPHASIYSGDSTSRTATVSARDFASLYHDCGYGKALARDPQSLSYVAQLQPGLRLLALDACRYEDNDFNASTCITAGRLKPATLSFIRRQTSEAKKAGCKVIAMMHHGVVPHFSLEGQTLPEYLVADYAAVGRLLDSCGVKVIFTGHLHQQDAAQSGSLTDVETGSTVSFPHPYRIVTVSDGKLHITTSHLRQLTSLARQHVNMLDKSRQFAMLAVEKMAGNHLPQHTPEPARKAIGQLLGQAYVISLNGDEKPDGAFLQLKQKVVDGIALLAPDKTRFVDAIATSLTSDVPPADNSLDINF